MTTFVEALVDAPDEGQAAIAASTILDGLLPGGSAISIEAPEMTVAVVEAFSGDHDHQSLVLAVMISVARWLGAWRRVASDAMIAALVGAEIEVQAILESFVHSRRSGLVSDDPEVRSLFYRLTGMVADPVVAAEYIRQSLLSEKSPLARACAFEGLMVAVIRSATESSEELALLRDAVRRDSLVASRVANAPYDYVGDSDELNVEQVEQALGVGLPARDYGNFWPSELL